MKLHSHWPTMHGMRGSVSQNAMSIGELILVFIKSIQRY
jgi:hypothetical protein